MLHPVETTLRHLIMKCFYMENTHTHFSCWAPKVFHLNYFWRRLNSHFNAQRLFCKMPIDVLQFCETNTQIIFTGSGDFLNVIYADTAGSIAYKFGHQPTKIASKIQFHFSSPFYLWHMSIEFSSAQQCLPLPYWSQESGFWLLAS